MSKNQYPARFRRPLAVIGAVAGLTATAAACTTETAGRATAPIVRHNIAPAPSKTPTSTPEKLPAAEVRFQETALKAAMQVAEDATNPKSFCEIASPTSITNKRLANEHGYGNKPGFPGILITYSPKERQVHMYDLTTPKPSATSRQPVLGLDMTFQERGPEPSILDRTLSAGASLTPEDYLAFFSNPNFAATSIRILESRSVSMDLHNTTYTFTGPNGNTEDMTEQNAHDMNAFSAELFRVSNTLHEGI